LCERSIEFFFYIVNEMQFSFKQFYKLPNVIEGGGVHVHQKFAWWQCMLFSG